MLRLIKNNKKSMKVLQNLKYLTFNKRIILKINFIAKKILLLKSTKGTQ